MILIDALKAIRDDFFPHHGEDAVSMKEYAEQALREFEAAEEVRAEESFDDILIG
jgi:hypothetical protein